MEIYDPNAWQSAALATISAFIVFGFILGAIIAFLKGGK